MAQRITHLLPRHKDQCLDLENKHHGKVSIVLCLKCQDMGGRDSGILSKVRARLMNSRLTREALLQRKNRRAIKDDTWY